MEPSAPISKKKKAPNYFSAQQNKCDKKAYCHVYASSFPVFISILIHLEDGN